MGKEKVLLVIVDYSTDGWTLNDILYEMKELVLACGGEVLESMVCPVKRISPAYWIGQGKVEEVAAFCSSNPVDLVVFSEELKGSQQRNLEEAFGVRTIDRTQLILDIFARHAKSLEGKMQVELAQLEYQLPRLVGKGVEMSRLGGGIGTLGPGETKLETDRRRIFERISKLKHELKEVSQERQLKRKKRQEQHVPLISLVGYTNAGKSTLLNTLTDAGQRTHEGLFTTLDSLSRQLVLPNRQAVVLSDTVGFMHDLPHNLIEAFKATLEEVQAADLLLHVIDAHHPNVEGLYSSVMKVLKGLDADHKPMITVLNKIDLVTDKEWLDIFLKQYPHAVAISSRTGENVQDLISKIEGFLSTWVTEIDMHIPISRMDLVNMAHSTGQVIAVKFYNEGIYIRASVPYHVAGHFHHAEIRSFEKET